MELGLQHAWSRDRENKRFAVVILVSALLHLALFIAFLNLKSFERKLIDPDKVYHVKIMNLSDIPIDIRGRLGGSGGAGHGSPSRPPGPLPKLRPRAEPPVVSDKPG